MIISLNFDVGAGPYLLLPPVGVATRAVLQDVPVAILLDLERHAAVDTLVARRNGIFVHNGECAHLKQFLDLLVTGT